MDPSGSAMPPPLFSRRCRSVSFWWCFFSSSSDSYGLCGRLLGKLRGFWWLVGCRRRLCLRTVEETADSASQSSGSLRFVSIVEWCSFDGRSIHGDGGSPGDDSFPAWLLLDRCIRGGARDSSDLWEGVRCSLWLWRYVATGPLWDGLALKVHRWRFYWLAWTLRCSDVPDNMIRLLPHITDQRRCKILFFELILCYKSS